MMMRLFVLLGIVGLTACSTPDYSEHIAVLDKNAKLVKDVKDRFLQLDSTKAASMYDDYTHTIQVFKQYYDVPTIDPVLTRRMTLYKALKSSKGYPSQRAAFLKEADYTLQQLADLKDALENNAIPEDSVQHYVDLEVKGAQTITAALNKYTDYFEKTIGIYDTLNPHIQIVVDSLLVANDVAEE